MQASSFGFSCVLAGAVAIGGCTSGVAGEEDGHVRLTLDSFDAAPGEQGLLCQVFANPLGRAIDVAEWGARIEEGGHHVTVYLVDDATPGPLGPCESGGSGIVFQTQTFGDSTLAYPEGTARRIRADQGILVQVHYLNVTDRTITVRNRIDLGLAPEGTVRAHVTPLQLETHDIAIPARSTGRAQRTCTLADDVELVWVTSHMHAHGTRFHAELDGEAIYESASWSDPLVIVLDPPRQLSAGQAITFTCEYDNASDTEVRFGLSLEQDEMCVLVGGVLGAAGDAPIRCNTSAPSTCLTCAEGIMQGRTDAFCTDDRSPSSAERYAALQACTCGADACLDACGDSACASGPPSDSCFDCIRARCAAESSTCFAD